MTLPPQHKLGAATRYFDFGIHAEIDAFTCGVRLAFEWVGGFRPIAEAHVDGASKEARYTNQVKRREQQFETRAQETLLIDIAQRRESQTGGEVCHLRLCARDDSR